MARSAAIPDRFRWHPEARLIGPDGATVQPEAGLPPPVIDHLECGRALAMVLRRAALGLPFRVGAETLPAPLAGTRPRSRPIFETLTSGSTGQPRRIRRSQRSWWASFVINRDLFGIGPGVRVAVPGRMMHSLSLYGALEGACLGAEVHLLAGLRPDAQVAALQARRIEVLYATPAQLRLMVERGGAQLPDLRLVLIGGAKLDDLLRAALAVVAPAAALREFYGAAEASFITLADATCAAGSVGRPYPGVRLEIRAEDGAVLKPGGLGEVWVRSPYLCDRYAEGQRLPPLRRGGWLSVGEMGWLERGELWLAGRRGRMVTVADQNVFPEEIEAFLAGLPGVDRVAVLPRADLMRGHVLVAVMQGDAAQQDAILHAARARLGTLKAPRMVIWRTDWPVLPSGKADLTRIAAEAGL